MKNITTTNDCFAQFNEALTAGINGLVKAGEIYVAAIDSDKANAQKFHERFAKMIPASAWSGFEAVGRKWMHPRMLMGGIADRKKNAIIKKLPYSVQEQVFSRGRFELLTAKGETLNIDVLEATPEQAEQVFDGSAVRNLAAQKAWLESRVVAEQIKPEVLPYTISDNKITFRRAVTMTRNEIKRILSEM